MIPRIIHQVWIGDQSKRPVRIMNTWKELNPTCEYKLWTEETLKEFTFVNQRQIDDMECLNGKTDVMRFEILHKYGGFLVDADSECLNGLDDFFFYNDRFTCYENEIKGFSEDGTLLVSEGHMGCAPNDQFFQHCIDALGKVETSYRQGWEVTGNLFWANMITKHKEEYPINIYPSWYFIPKHGTGVSYDGKDKIYAKHYWGSTFGIYGTEEMA